MARPSLYSEELNERAEQLARLGATDAEIAEAIGVHEATIYEWKNKFPKFSEAIKRGKIPADCEVANALFTKATGSEWVEEQAIKVKSVKYENGKRVSEDERVEVVEVTRRAPPDTTAGIFWLKNRRSQDWRDKRDIEVTPSRTEEEIDADIRSLLAGFAVEAEGGAEEPTTREESGSDE